MASFPFNSFPLASRALPNVSLNRPKPRPTFTCKASGADDKLDRRDILIGLGGLYGLGTSLPALGLPIEAPELSQCGEPDLPTGARPIKCCPPASSKIKDFKFPSPSAPLRIRPPAHAVDAEYISKYQEAVYKMKLLEPTDPRSFSQQARVHCAYCDGAYTQVGFEDLDLQVHFSWLFFPFHRFYLHFYERILGSLIGDDTFGLPFWNWDHPAGMTLPLMYTDKNSPLYDTLRDVNHTPSTLINLDFNSPSDGPLSPAQQIDHNLTIMHRSVVDATKANLYMGRTYRRGSPPNTDQGPGPVSMENVPHSPVHYWTGDKRQKNAENMGNLYSAAFDPIFYSHHANIDRLWDVWLSLDGGNRRNFTDPDWLNSQFLFYDENADVVKVTIKDCLDMSKLRYCYQKVSNPWINSRPSPAVTVKKRTATVKKPPTAGEIKFPIILDKPVSVTVSRKRPSRSQNEKDKEEEVLTVGGLEIPKGEYTKFDVYINAPEGQEGVTAATSEFAGSFVSVAHNHIKEATLRTSLRLGISRLLEDLKAEGDESIIVTLVPRMGKVKVGGISIEFDS
uniref:Polyphenol oxidase 3 n=1 Tax=Lilium hybrid cultivar TaxID=156531 RepID=A0A173DSG7_9LILI|nr:polyphenol oxidase 3 [Lilium hybrid cultivar]